LLKKDFTGKDREKMLQIKSASTRAEALTRQLLAFSRKQMVQPKVIQLNTIINNSFKMFTRLIGEDIKIELLLAEDLPTIVADSHQIEQILINLIVNARDAIRLCGDENERSIKIRTQRTYLDQKYAKKHGIKEGHYVELSISDTGIGMNKQTLDKIFEPFYTTKDQGKGTGLGLSTVYGIVKQNNATINVYSEENNGSIFRIYWPVSEQEIEKLTANSSDAIHKGKERILLVEDDHDVRELGEESLLSLGYTVYTACDAQEALRKIKDEKINPHLLITDVIMPRMSGEELAREVTNILPDIAVIFTSGYTNDHIVIEGFIDKDINFLGKPYTISTLSQKIAEVLRQENN
jgi:CheY-like chemotaxis protein